jgi:hypothetical protein
MIIGVKECVEIVFYERGSLNSGFAKPAETRAHWLLFNSVVHTTAATQGSRDDYFGHIEHNVSVTLFP